MSRFVHIHVEEEGLRVDKLLASSLEELTRSAVQNLIEEGRVTCCGRPLTKSAKHTFTREYSAVVYGGFSQESGVVDAPIGRHPTERKKMAVLLNSSSARHALTHYWVVKRFSGFTQLRLQLETGRTHQIRVHMAYIGHPVAGDPVYGPKKVITSLQGQCLHAGKIGFIHPRSKEYLELEAPLPAYFTSFLSKLKEA